MSFGSSSTRSPTPIRRRRGDHLRFALRARGHPKLARRHAARDRAGHGSHRARPHRARGRGRRSGERRWLRGRGRPRRHAGARGHARPRERTRPHGLGRIRDRNARSRRGRSDDAPRHAAQLHSRHHERGRAPRESARRSWQGLGRRRVHWRSPSGQCVGVRRPRTSRRASVQMLSGTVGCSRVPARDAAGSARSDACSRRARA